MKEFLQETKILNYSHPTIQKLINSRGWSTQNDKDKIYNIYNFIRDEIKFGYNKKDNLKSSKILKDGYGQCNTKGILFMSLLRAVNIPCRIHAFYVDKKLQKGILKGFYYKLSPNEILHSWVEIYYNNEWLEIEGFILDIEYVKKLQNKFNNCPTNFCGFGVATTNFSNPQIEWQENNTYIQKEAITQDLGLYNSPDNLFKTHKQTINCFKNFFYKNLIRHLMNNNVKKIKKGK